MDAPVIVPCGLPGGPTDDLASFRVFGLRLSGADLPSRGAYVTVRATRDADALAVIAWQPFACLPPRGADRNTVLRATAEVMRAIRQDEQTVPRADGPLVLISGLRRNDETGGYYRELVLRRSTLDLDGPLAHSDPDMLWCSVFEREEDSPNSLPRHTVEP